MLTRLEIEEAIRTLLLKYHAESAILFGSYARNEATDDSDVDILVIGGEAFRKTNIFAFAEDLRELLGKDVDAFELCELNPNTPLYHSVMEEGVRIAC